MPAKTTTPAVVDQPADNLKPRPDFPLTAHRGAGQWCKKIKGRVHYFGKLADPAAVEKRYDAERADLEAGRVPRSRPKNPRFVCGSLQVASPEIVGPPPVN